MTYKLFRNHFPYVTVLTSISPFLGWFCWEQFFRIPFIHRNKEAAKAFNGDTPFYGKSWGYATDYLVQLSLKEGDLIFFSSDPRALPVHRATAKIISNYFHDSEFDEVGIIHLNNGICYILCFTAAGKIKLEKYSEKLAISQPRIVFVRRLQGVPTYVRENISKFIQNLASLTLESNIAIQLWTHFRRMQAWRPYFQKIPEMLQHEWELRSHKAIQIKLLELLEDLMQFQFDEDSWNESYAVIGYSCQYDRIITYLHDKNILPAECNSRGVVDTFFVQRVYAILDIVKNTQARIESLEEISHNVKLENRRSFDGFSLKNENITSLNVIASRLRSMFCCQTNQTTNAAMVASVYQNAALLHLFPFSYMWTISDLLVIKWLSGGDIPVSANNCSRSILPSLSSGFYIREEEIERIQKNRFNYIKLTNEGAPHVLN